MADDQSPASGTALRRNSVGVMGILLFVLSAQAPLTGIAGALPLTVLLGNGAGAPGAYLIIGVVIVLFAVGFIAMSRRVEGRGAFFAYIEAGMGRRMGAGSAWLAIAAYATIQAGMYGLYGASVSALLAGIGLDVHWLVPVVVTIAAVQALGSLNLEVGAKVLAVLVALEVAILLVFGIAVVIGGGGPEGSLDLGANFSPEAVFAGAPGVALMFAVASMFGFESTAIYSGEAKDAKRTVARATYLSVSVIAIFFAFISWTFISYYGAGNAAAAAEAAVASGEATVFVLTALEGTLGGWAGVTTSILLATSLFAGVLAFHNGINRYLHALGTKRLLPAALAQTNRHGSPKHAGWVQTAMALLLTLPFAVLGLDPIVNLFSWFSGLAVACLVLLYALCSIAVIVYSFRHRTGQVWQFRVAPAAATLLLVTVLVALVVNFTSLIGGDALTAGLLLAVAPVVFLVGFVARRRTLAGPTHERTI